ncbi:Scj1 protein [Martiniozyma asiatica (nom. inval.)]|nr:Scj1 protein [Martiniozyma asiatica]
MKSLSFILLLTAFFSFVIAGKDFYAVLGVSKNANEKEIKNAYRQLSKKYHPDKNSDESAQSKFIEIGEAYEVLMDSEKRSIYDRFGSDALNGGQQQQHGGGDPFGSMFSNFFNGGNPGGFQQQRQHPKAQPLIQQVALSLFDFYNGRNVDILIKVVDICENCSGSGSRDGKVHNCSDCRGKGRISKKQQLAPGMFQQFEIPCQKCAGKGKVIKNKCGICHGKGAHEVEKIVNLHVNPGDQVGKNTILQNEGSKAPGIDAGDVIFQLVESNDSNFGYWRIGQNLYRTEVLSLKEALGGGWTKEIQFFDEYQPTINLHRNEGVIVTPGEVEIIKGKGMPNGYDEYGDLYVEYKVVFPINNPKLVKQIHDEL